MAMAAMMPITARTMMTTPMIPTTFSQVRVIRSGPKRLAALGSTLQEQEQHQKDVDQWHQNEQGIPAGGVDVMQAPDHEEHDNDQGDQANDDDHRQGLGGNLWGYGVARGVECGGE